MAHANPSVAFPRTALISRGNIPARVSKNQSFSKSASEAAQWNFFSRIPVSFLLYFFECLIPLGSIFKSEVSVEHHWKT